MRKGLLQEWGRVMMAITLTTCLAVSGVAAPVAAVLLAIINAPNLSQNLSDDFLQVVLLLVWYGFLVIVAIVILAGISKIISYGIGLALVKLDDFIFRERPARINFKGNQIQLGERGEFYVQVKNRYWSSIDNVSVQILLAQRDHKSFVPFEQPIKWRGLETHNSAVSIKGLRSRLLHFASIDENSRIFIHTGSGAMLISPNPEGYTFSLSAYVTIQKSSISKSNGFDVLVTYNDDNKPQFKVKKVYGKKRNYYVG